MVTVELARPLERIDKVRELPKRQIPEKIDLSTIFKGEDAKFLQGRTPEQISVIHRVAFLRYKVRNGEIPLEHATLSPDERKVTETLKRELGVVHKAVPIINVHSRITASALAVHGEVRIGEVTDQESFF